MLWPFMLSWFLSLIVKDFYYTSLWQTKEYRFDRFRDHISSKDGFLSFLPWAFWMLFILWILLFLSGDIFQSTYQRDYVLWGIINFYLVRAWYQIVSVLKMSFKRPKLTIKAALILFGSLFATLATVMVIYRSIDFSIVNGLLILMGAELVFPLMNALMVTFFKPLTYFAKGRLLKKAREKMKQYPDVKVIGITGSFGKTSTKEFLTTILSTKFKVFATPEHVNSELGVANLVLKGIPADTEVFIVEMGAYKKGEIADICEMVSPEVGIVTGVNAQHLSLFGSQENIVQAKSELICSLPVKGLAILNCDSEGCRQMSGWTKASVFSYSFGNGGRDIEAKNAKQERDKITFTLSRNGDQVECEASLLGLYHISNILAAAGAALHLGMNLGEIAEAVKTLKPYTRTMEPKQGKNDILLIDDSYNANPDGVLVALDYMDAVEAPHKILVMSYLRELGEESAKAHFAIGKRAAKVCDEIVMIEEPFFADLQRGALEGGMSQNQVHLATEMKPPASGSIVLFEGRGTEKLLQTLL